MAGRKKNTNGTAEVPVASVIHHLERSADSATLQKTGQIRNQKIKPGTFRSKDELNSSELLKVLVEVKNGNFSARMPLDKMGISGKICDILNEIISLNEILVEE